MTRTELIDKLASSVGVEKATSTVAQACAELRLGSGELQPDQMLQVLERLAEDGGLIGTVARFMKVRVILAGPAPQGLGIRPPITGATPALSSQPSQHSTASAVPGAVYDPKLNRPK